MDASQALTTYLRAAREALLWKLEGLGERDARRPLTPTGTNLLGLVKHALLVEHGYFGACLGRDPGIEGVPHYEFGDDDPNADFYATADESAASLAALYGRVGAYVDATLTELPLNTPAHVPWWGERGDTTLARLAPHVLADISRHAGHADILRELLDGRAGMSEARSNLWEPTEGWDAYRARLQALADRFA